MTRAVVVLSMVIGAVGMLGAQSGGQSTANRAPATPTASRPKVPNTYDPSKSQTVVGCLRSGTQNGQFLLADATTSNATGTVGTSGTAKKTYSIAGVIPPGIKLQSHVNHKVELTGSMTGGDKFEMERFKMLSSTCS
jgi:hypothetical protein